jgi:hypothetical protein
MNNNSNNILPEHFLTYINYELSFFERIADRRFFINILSNDRLELKISESKETKEYNDHSQSKHQLIFTANNIHRFIKNLLLIREYIIKNSDNSITTTLHLIN